MCTYEARVLQALTCDTECCKRWHLALPSVSSASLRGDMYFMAVASRSRSP